MHTVSGSNRPVSYKRNMHSGGPRWLHYNLAVYPQVRADFTIIDGIEGMKAMARLAAQLVDHRIALAGQDAVAIDSLCCKMMDISLDDVGYLTYL